jgi:hypothetical protein
MPIASSTSLTVWWERNGRRTVTPRDSGAKKSFSSAYARTST